MFVFVHVCTCWLVYCMCMSDWGRRGVSCLLIPMCVRDGCECVSLRAACARTCVCVVFLTNKPPDKKTKKQANLYISA